MATIKETIDVIKEKIGEENSALISNEIADILTADKAYGDKTSEQEKAIETLKSEKETLVTTNGKLFERLGFENDKKTTFEGENKSAEEKHEIGISDIINEKGEII